MTDESTTTPQEASVALTTTEGQALVAEPSAPPAEAPLSIAEDIVVVAKTREEMETAQRSLVGWIEPKIQGLEQDVLEAQTNLDTATKRKWATAPFRKALTVAVSRVAYYQRIRSALLAGYVIMPDMPGVTIAVRTSQARPRAHKIKSTYYGKTLPSATSDASPAGKGRYIDPTIKYETWDEAGQKDSLGRDTTVHIARANSFDPEFEFPIKLVKPQILDDTSRAMMHKIFDEIGIIGAGSPKPGQKLHATTLHGDPIVLGRVVRYEGTKRFSCAFLITWWLDTKTI